MTNLKPECPKCGASGPGVCPERPRQQVNLSGLGWRTVPRKIEQCIRHHEAMTEIELTIQRAYQSVLGQ